MFNSMQSTQQLVAALEDTQASLASALSRIEAYKIRENFLLEENLRLEQELSTCVGPAEQTSSTSRHFLSTQRIDSSNYRFHEEYPVTLHTKKGAVAGVVTASPEHLEFYESKARISATKFVGMTSLTNKNNHKGPGGSPKHNSKNWPWTLFGKSKTAEDINLQEKGTGSNLASTGPQLQRSSWNGPVQASEFDNHKQHSTNEEINRNKTVIWRVLWKDGGGSTKVKQLTFEANDDAKAFIKRQIEGWSDAASRVASVDDANASVSFNKGAPQEEVDYSTPGSIVPAKHLIPNGPFPGLSSPSTLLTEEHVRCLTSAIPPRHRHSTWSLCYSTDRDGMSLQTLFRKAQGCAPTVLVIKDFADFIFGSYCSEAWKVSQRFYGTGETFIFQLEPNRVYYTWKQESTTPNSYFMFASHDTLGVGGTGHFSIWLDSELLDGHSGACDTFGSPCIASKEAFRISKLELWAIA